MKDESKEEMMEGIEMNQEITRKRNSENTTNEEKDMEIFSSEQQRNKGQVGKERSYDNGP